MARSSCNCLRSRHKPNIPTIAKMRHWWNNTFFLIIRVMIFLNQLVVMAPFIYTLRKTSTTAATSGQDTTILTKLHFRTNRKVTVMAILLCIFLSAVAPFLVKMTTDLYDTTRNSPDDGKRNIQDDLFMIIAKFTMSTDVLCSMLIMAAQIWNREKIVEILNLFAGVVEKMQHFEMDFVSFKIFTALMIKVGLAIYNLVLSLPFIVSASSRLSTSDILAFMGNLFLQHLSSIFALTLSTFLLLLLTLSQQLEKQLSLFQNTSSNMKMLQLISLQNSLHRLITLFIGTFQFGLFLIILLNFVTILCNIYAMLDYYVTTQHFYWTFITYILSNVYELYSLILLAYLCDRSQCKVRDLFLVREEQYFLKVPSAFEMIDSNVLWPQRQEFYILGLFSLDNDFALFLLSYSVNFIVIILSLYQTATQ